MSYEIVKSLSLDKAKKIVRGSSHCNNVIPYQVHQWSEDSTLSKIYQQDGEDVVIKTLLNCYATGEFHDTKGGKPNQYSLAVWYATTTKEYEDLGSYPFRGTPEEKSEYYNKRTEILWNCYQVYKHRKLGKYVLKLSMNSVFVHKKANPRKCWCSSSVEAAQTFNSVEEALAFRARNNYSTTYIPFAID